MRLTPIRVRGKRKTEATVKPAKRKIGDDTASPRKRQLRPVKKSLLERQLPFDIVESIFLHSENVNFPRASPLLGRLLSGRQTLVAITVAAFGPTWDETFELTYGTEGPDVHPVAQSLQLPKLPTGEQLEIIPGDPSFQSAILASRWATIDVILEAQQLWARQTAKLRGIDFKGAKAEDLQDESPPRNPRKDGLGRFDAHACLAYDFNRLDGPRSFVPSVLRRRYTLYVDVHPELRIPDALITGPWDEEMLKLIGLNNAFAQDRPQHPLLSQLIFWLFQRDDFFWNWEFDNEVHSITFEVFPSWPQHVLVSLHERLQDWNWSRGNQQPQHTTERVDHLMQYIAYALNHAGPGDKDSGLW